MTEASLNTPDPQRLPGRGLSGRGRLGAAAVALACLGVLLIAAGLHADASGAGTHEQIGLPPCGFLLVTGQPCATCGMTTAFTHAADGHFGLAFATQPMGLLLAVLVAALFWGGAYAALTGTTLNRLYAVLLRPRAVVVIVLLFFAAWGYKALTY
jgi:hypothetical protein